VLGTRAKKGLDLGARDAQVNRIEVVLGHESPGYLPDVTVARGRELVDAVVAAIDERRGPASAEDSDDEGHALEIRDADRRCLGARGVAERSEHVEQRRDAELLARRAGVAEPRVEEGGEGEGDPGLAQHLGDTLRRDVEVEAQGGEHVGRPGCRAGAAVAVFDHGHSRGRRDDGGDGRDVQHSPVRIATRADDVEHHRVDLERQGIGEHGIPEADYLVNGLPFDPKSDEKAGELRRRRLPRDDRLHGPLRFADGEVVALDEGAENAGPGVVA
jgi:hypothetical protein